LLLANICARGQLFDSDVYKVNPLIDASITIAATVTNYYGLRVVDRKSPLDSTEISLLDANDINAFDRSATQQDASYIYRAWEISDIGMRGSLLLPLLLVLDKEIRQDWAPVLLLFLQSEAVIGNLFSWGAAIHIDRIRPLVYHPELGNKKFIFYGLALIPPVFTGYYRYKGMKHFPTDVLTGLAVGAATGILIPHLHKHRKNKNLTFMPVAGRYTGLAVNWEF